MSNDIANEIASRIGAAAELVQIGQGTLLILEHASGFIQPNRERREFIPVKEKQKSQLSL